MGAKTQQSEAGGGPGQGASGVTAILCALPGELGDLRGRELSRETVGGDLLIELDLPGGATACVCGVGKVAAARGATRLIDRRSPARLLVIGVCGGLRRHLGPGTLVHCSVAAQADFAVREGRESRADPELLGAWRAQVPGPAGWFLTADRPVLSWWRRLRLARAFAGDCIADMETAAAAAVCEHAGVPWAALRAVSDRAGTGSALAFQRNYPRVAGLAAATVAPLLSFLLDSLPGSPGAVPVSSPPTDR